MRPLLRPLLAASLLLALAAPASAATIVSLALDPSQSSLTPQVGGAQSLSGTITLRLGALPLGGVDTAFDVIGLSAVASGGATITLDPDVANPGLGVLTPAGAFVVPILYVLLNREQKPGEGPEPESESGGLAPPATA